MSLTINILVKNNERTIEDSIKQIYPLCDKIIIGDAGSSVDVINTCKSFKKVEVVNVPFKNDFSEAKNYMIKYNKSWMMFLEPYESIVSFPDKIDLSDENVTYRIKKINGDLITKELRIWHKNKNIRFKNPIFESADPGEGATNLEVYITPNKEYLDEEKIKILNDWRLRSPTHDEPLYYLSCIHLLRKEWKNFVNTGETYLYKSTSNRPSSLMTRYYLSMVKSYVKSEYDYEGALRYITSCIAEKPLMAEFWCMLGDIFYKNNDLQRAKNFYENALILGSRRIDNDELPIEISKYKKYPLKMIDACENIKENTQVYTASK
jgi:tetratricopeptide (TPR) repeat protein